MSTYSLGEASIGVCELTTNQVGKIASTKSTELMAKGNLPLLHSFELIPYDTACAKLSCPLKIPEYRVSSKMLSVIVESK